MIAPELLIESLPLAAQVARLRLVDPVERRPVGLVTADRSPRPPSLNALSAAMKGLAKELNATLG